MRIAFIARRSAALVALCLAIGISGCAFYQDVKPTDPKSGSPFFVRKVDSLTPTLNWRWRVHPDYEGNFDLMVYTLDESDDIQVAYFVQDLPGHSHTLTRALDPNTVYHWSVRRHEKGGKWQKYDYFGYWYFLVTFSRGMPFKFKTPDGPAASAPATPDAPLQATTPSI